MDKSEIEQLKKRWTIQQMSQGEAALVGKSTSPFPVMDDGFLDLRGMVIAQFVKNITINCVDLSGAALERAGQFGMCKIEKVRFCFASLQTNLGKIFNSCDFTSANLSGAVLRGEFSGCDFSMANLTSAIGTEVRFVKCVFVKTNFRKASLVHCSFEDCRFEECKFGSGSLSSSRFIRTPIPADLGNTLMEKIKLT
nr:pentapeptide repeat-containing protein [uncultured Undibacterium sp.]